MTIGVVALFLLVLSTACLSVVLTGAGVAGAVDFKSEGKAAYLVDASTGTVLYSRNEKARLPIASMVKIMTSLLTFEAVDRGEVGYDDDVAVSREAAAMGGSQVFLDAGSTHKLDSLLKSVIVASANDSCVALAEHISGSISAFVDKMNDRAKELGMFNTSFKNCTGLPAAESFSSAEDASIMFRELIKHPKYFEYAAVWLEDFKHPSGRVTSITNTNKLVRFYDGCDGGKTGYTSEAKFCLSATAKKGGMRVVAVMIGANSSKDRNAAVSAMFDYAFDNYVNETLLKAGEPIERTVSVRGAKVGEVQLTVDCDLANFRHREEKGEYEVRYELPNAVKAPVKSGDALGKAHLVKNGEIIKTVNVLSLQDAPRMTLFDAIGEIGKHWSTSTK